MQDSVISEIDLKQKEDRDEHSELRSEEDALIKTRDQTRPSLHVIRERIGMTANLKMLRKRREEIRKIVYDVKGISGDDEIRSPMRNIKHLNSLTSITINFDQCELLTDTGMRFLSHCLRNFTSLTSLTLNFGKCLRITDPGLVSLCDCLRHLTSLTCISLDLSLGGTITDVGLRSISSCIKHLTSLTSLTLHLPMNPVTEEGVKYLIRNLRRRPSLISWIVINSVWFKVTATRVAYWKGMQTNRSISWKDIGKLILLGGLIFGIPHLLIDLFFK